MFDHRGRLDIFENFVVDNGLPKHRPKQVSNFGVTSTNFTSSNIVVLNSSGASMQAVWGSTGSTDRRNLFARVWERLVEWWRDTQRVPVEDFFRSIKNNVEELEVVEHRLQGYVAAIEQARRNGQTALAEQLESAVEGVRAETQLVALKLREYLTEEQLVEFVKKAKKGLRLDWLKNFTRMIPDSVMKAKTAADERNVFDNYVVLHYDPAKKAWAETKEETERRKDPILFGVLRGRRRLYLVGDWVDEFCDLTFDQIADAMGSDNVRSLPKDFVVEAKAS